MNATCDECLTDLDDTACEHGCCGECWTRCLACEIEHVDARAELDRDYELENY